MEFTTTAGTFGVETDTKTMSKFKKYNQQCGTSTRITNAERVLVLLTLPLNVSVAAGVSLIERTAEQTFPTLGFTPRKTNVQISVQQGFIRWHDATIGPRLSLQHVP